MTTLKTDITQFNGDAGGVHTALYAERKMLVQNEIHNRANRIETASQKWREDPGSCFHELLDSMPNSACKLMAFKLFTHAFHGNIDVYLKRLRNDYLNFKSQEKS